MRRRRTSRLLVLAAISLSVSGLVVSSCGETGGAKDGATDGGGEAEPFPASVPGLDGGSVALSVPGRPSVVAFVAAWCAPCHVELPELQELHEQLGDEATIVAVAVEEEPEATRGLIEETGVQFPVGLDEDGILLMEAGIAALPGTIVLDADGNVVRRFRGVVTGAEVEAELEPLLATT